MMKDLRSFIIDPLMKKPAERHYDHPYEERSSPRTILKEAVVTMRGGALWHCNRPV